MANNFAEIFELLFPWHNRKKYGSHRHSCLAYKMFFWFHLVISGLMSERFEFFIVQLIQLIGSTNPRFNRKSFFALKVCVLFHKILLTRKKCYGALQ